MSTSWRRAFCTTAPRNSDAAAPGLEKQHTEYTLSSSPSPRKLAFFSRGSNPSTPKLSSSPSLTCRTKDAETPSSRKSLTTSSNPSSPRTPLKLSLFRNSFKFRSSCGICLNSVKTGQGTAKYTAECSHSFHFHCISGYVQKHGKLVCPVCNLIWKDASLLAPHQHITESPVEDSVSVIKEKTINVVTSSPTVKQRKKYSRFYDDDETLISPRFVPVPEDDVAQFKGFVINPNPNFAAKSQIQAKGRDFGNVQVSLLNEAAIVSVGYGYETRAVALRVKAPPPEVGSRLLDPSQRAPVDLVVVVNVGGTIAKHEMVKRAMRLVISSLGSADRLSIITTAPKRLLPLKRMTEHGKISAGAVVDELLYSQGSDTSEALRKATSVLEGRREKNPVANIVFLSDGQDQGRVHTNQRSTIPYIEIPVTEYGFSKEAFTKCIGGLLSVMVQDLRIQIRVGSESGPCEITAVYLSNKRPTLVSSGSGSVRLGDLYAGEERELLVELKVPSTATMTKQVLSVRGLYKDPSTQEVVYGRDKSLQVPQAVRSISPRIQRLRCLFIATRAVAESRRLMEYGECTSAYHLLTSAKGLLGQSGTTEAAEYVKVVEAELVEVKWRGQEVMEYQNHHQEQHGQPLTPASAWRAAEKSAMVKKRDLHGLENARF